MVDGHGAGHVDDAALDRAVSRRLVAAFQPPAGTGVDDGTAAGLSHLGNDVFAHQEQSLETDVQHEIPFLFAERVDGLAHGDPGVVVQDVDMSKRGDDAFDSLLHVLFVRYVAAEKLHVSSRFAEFACFLFACRVHIHDRDGSAVGGEHVRDREADAGTCPGDDGGFSTEIQIVFSFKHSALLSAREGQDLLQVYLYHTIEKQKAL